MVGCAETPATFDWVTPEDNAAIAAGDAIELAVDTTESGNVRFAVDGVELGVCDPTALDEDCARDAIYRWTTAFEPGRHELSATLVGLDGEGDAMTILRTIDVAIELPPAAYADEPGVTIAAAGAGSLDPSTAYHSVFGSIQWKLSGQRVVLHSGTPVGSVSAVQACMNRYGASIRRWADHYGLSRASVVATAITESNCTNPAGSSDGLSSGPMQVTASTCAAITGLSRATCRTRMHTQPDFSFEVGVRYMSTTSQRAQHHRDPPKIAAAYNAGSVRRSTGNRWHMVSTGNHIDRWVNAYNAYRTWSGP